MKDTYLSERMGSAKETRVKLRQCPHCLGLFAQQEYGHRRTCKNCETPVALAAFGLGWEDLMVRCGISREQAKAIVFGRRKTEAS